MNNGNGPNSNSGHDGAPGPFKNGIFADGLPPGLDELPPGLMAMLEAMSEDPPFEEDGESPSESEDEDSEDDGEDESEGESEQEFVFKGTPDDDTFTGTDADERIKGGPGDDNLAGGGGDDDLEGGPGDDFLGGGDGSDELKGGPGDDQLSGGAGNDVLIAGPGNDQLMGGEGDDVYVFGGSLDPIPEDEPEDEPPDDEEESTEDEDSSEEDGSSEDEGEPETASASAKADNPGKGNGNGKGNSGKGKAAGEDEDDESEELEFEDSSEDTSESSDDNDEDESDDVDEDEIEDDEEDEDEDEDDSEDGETGLAWGDNVIEDSSGNETVRFDGEARSVLQNEQDGSDLILSAGNGSLRITGYYDDPGRWTFEDDLGTFDPTDDGESEPPAEDPGDTPETASAIESGFETSGDVGFEEDAADVFALTAPGDGDVVINLTGLSGTANLRLLDGEGTVQAEASAMDGSETLVVPVTGGTQHFLEVTDGGDSGAEYGLAVDFTPDWGNTLETATPVEMLDGWALTATVGFGDDTGDFAQFTPEADGTLVVEVDGGDNDPSLTLLSATGDVLAEGVPNGFGENRFEFELTGGETYVVAIEPDGDPATYVAGSAYSVTPDEGEAPAVVDVESFSS